MFEFLKRKMFDFDEISTRINQELANKTDGLSLDEKVQFTLQSKKEALATLHSLVHTFGNNDYTRRIVNELKNIDGYDPISDLIHFESNDVDNTSSILHSERCFYQINFFIAVFDYIRQVQKDSTADAQFFYILYDECLKKVGKKSHYGYCQPPN